MRIIPYRLRKSSVYTIKQCKPCICGSRKVNVNNNTGWSEKSIKCQRCDREVFADTIERAISKWNKEYDNKFPDGFADW